jgi:hypothetical protein
MQLPSEHQNVMITYETLVGYGPYGDDKRKEVVTRRAFYSKSDGYYDSKDNWIETPNGFFSVPQYWRNFTFSDGSIALLPHGFNQYPRVYPNQIIKWEYDK